MTDGSFWQYDAADKLLSYGSGGVNYSVTYDGDGDTKMITGGTQSAAFSWDDRGKLLSQTGITYEYDALGRRVMATSATGAVTYYIYDGDMLLGEIQPGAISG